MSSPFWLRLVLVVGIVWLAVAVIHGVNVAIRHVGGDPAEISSPRR